jgi:hypothetical protein
MPMGPGGDLGLQHPRGPSIEPHRRCFKVEQVGHAGEAERPRLTASRNADRERLARAMWAMHRPFLWVSFHLSFLCASIGGVRTP